MLQGDGDLCRRRYEKIEVRSKISRTGIPHLAAKPLFSAGENRNAWQDTGDLIMRMNFSGGVIILALISVFSVAAQNVRVNIGKRATAIPKVCESVTPASIENQVDIPTLVKEAFC